MLRASVTLQLQNDTRRLRSLSMNRWTRYFLKRVEILSELARHWAAGHLSASAAGLPHLAAKIRREHFHGAAHFIQPRTHPGADAIP